MDLSKKKAQLVKSTAALIILRWRLSKDSKSAAGLSTDIENSEARTIALADEVSFSSTRPASAPRANAKEEVTTYYMSKHSVWPSSPMPEAPQADLWPRVAGDRPSPMLNALSTSVYLGLTPLLESAEMYLIGDQVSALRFVNCNV